MATIIEALLKATDLLDAGRLDEAETICRRILAVAPETADARQLLGIRLARGGGRNASAGFLRQAAALAPERPDILRNLALVVGDRTTALKALRAARRLAPDDADTARDLVQALTAHADEAFDGGRPTEASALYGEALHLEPRSVLLHFNRAAADRDAGRAAEAAEGFAAAARLDPTLAPAHLEHGLAVQRLGLDAGTSFRRSLALDPANGRATHALAVASKERTRLEARAITLAPSLAEAHFGWALQNQREGRNRAAVAGYRRVLALEPTSSEALINLCDARAAMSDFTGASRAGERAALVAPDVADAFLALGNVLQTCRQNAGAAAFYRRALAENPARADVRGNLGLVLSRLGRTVAAADQLRAAVALRPESRAHLGNLGAVFRDLGRIKDSLASYRRALIIDPSRADAHSSMIFAMDFDPDLTTADLQAERRRYNERHVVPLRAARRPLVVDRSPERRLRVGHVTADFCANSAAFAFGPVLRLMDRRRFEVVCYSEVVVEDEMTRSFRANADRWRSTRGLSDDELADLIRADRIDILVDMSTHTAGNRLPVFARRPAPVQVSAWTYPHGVGVETIDWILTDPVTIPLHERPLLMEGAWDLPCVLVYEAPANTPAVAPPPALAAGTVTFGSFNRLAKVTPPVLDLWCRVLRACPTTTLLLKDAALTETRVVEEFRARMTERGVDPRRLRVMGATPHFEHLAAYAHVDIALDPFPLNGGITTTEALWMGVPVVAMSGNKPPSRVSAAILGSLGLSDWIGLDPDEYVSKAVAKASDIARLARLRSELRPRFAAAPVGDAALYTREVETAYRSMWRRWCERATD